MGLDRDKWFAIGLDIGGGESARSLRIVAALRDLLTEGRGPLKLAATNGGEIPGTEFLVLDADPYEVLQANTHMLELSAGQDIPIRIEPSQTCPTCSSRAAGAQRSPARLRVPLPRA